MPKGKQGGRREFVKLLRDMGDYTPFAIQEVWSEKEARKEYSRLRNIVVKRLKRIRETEPEAKVLERWKPESFKSLREVRDIRELSHLLSDVAYLVNAKTASLTGRTEIKKQILEALQEQGIDIDSKDLKRYGEFMTLVRDFASDRLYDSERASTIFSEYKETSDNRELLDMYKEFARHRRTKPRGAKE